MTDEDLAKTPEEIKEIAVAIVTSALTARQSETLQERFDMFGSDFKMLLNDSTGVDVYRLTSLLADLSSHLVETLARTLGQEPEVLMQYVAQEVLGTPITEVDGNEL